MGENKKVKRMSINEVKTVFSEIGKTEQVLYVGRKKYTLDSNTGAIVCFDEDYGSNFDHIYKTNKTTLLKSFPLGTWDSCQFGAATEAEGKAFFEFVVENSAVEWGMTIGNGYGDRYAMIYTDGDKNNVAPRRTADTVELIHSHSQSSDPSPGDIRYAQLYPQYTYKIYYNGYYREYTGSTHY